MVIAALGVGQRPRIGTWLAFWTAVTTSSTSIDAALASEPAAREAARPPDSAALEVEPHRWRRRASSLALGGFVVVCLACFVLSLRVPLANRNGGGGNLHAVQARAFLAGRLDIDVPGFYDSCAYRGRTYVPFPPMPAVLMMPIVAAIGIERTHGTIIALALTLLNVAVGYRLARRLGLSPTARVWWLVAMLFGTGYWAAVCGSTGVWFYAQVVAFTALLLAVAEAWGKGRGLWVGLALAAAFLSRQLTLFAGFALAARLWSHPRFIDRRARWLNLARFGAAAGLGVAVYLAFNYARFGNPFETGYRYIELDGMLKERFARHGLFSAAYIPFNLIYLLVQGVHVDFTSPAKLAGVTPDLYGASLLGASPYVVVATFARRAGAPIRALWLSVAATAAVHLLYLNNGASQVNTQRFTLDFIPVLFVLVAIGLRREADRDRARLWQGAIAYAVVVNALVHAVFPALDGAFHALER